MSSIMDRLPYTCLLIFYCFTFVCTYGGGEDLHPSCEVGLMVRRGTTQIATPQHRVTVRCPVRHCGEPLNVNWYKLLDADKYQQIRQTENVEIMQNDKHTKDELISFLIFKRISIYDNGLYRCDLKGDKYEVVSHTINISVSDLHKGAKNSDNNADELPSVAGVEEDEDWFWLPYFSICISIALLIATLTVLTLLRFYGWKRILTFNNKKGQEMSTHIIPDLPKGSASSTLFLQTHFLFLDEIHSPSTAAERPPSQPPHMTNRNQPAVSNTADESQPSDHAVYSVINHRQSGTPAREQQRTATKPNKNSEYASINVS